MKTDLAHLLLVIRQEDLDGVKRLCKNDPEVVEKQDEKGNTALQVRESACSSLRMHVHAARSLVNTHIGALPALCECSCCSGIAWCYVCFWRGSKPRRKSVSVLFVPSCLGLLLQARGSMRDTDEQQEYSNAVIIIDALSSFTHHSVPVLWATFPSCAACSTLPMVETSWTEATRAVA